MGRSKCVRSSASKKVMSYSEFNSRLRKTFYYGSSKLCEDEMEVSRPLAEYASDIFSEPHKGHSLNRLNTIAAGSVHATPCSLIMALIYLDRLNATDPCYARRITPQELFIVSMMISTKFYSGHDEEIFLSDWAADGNMTEERLKQLELEFLGAIEWNVYISNEQFFSKLQLVEKTIARREGLKRGWLTYTELVQMLPSFTLAKFLLNNFALLAMSYAASVMTLAGAFFLASQIPIQSAKIMSSTQVNMAVDTTETLARTNRSCIGIKTIIKKTSQIANDTPISSSISCMPFNIEAELLKLEHQYQEEKRLADLQNRQHELKTDSRLTLPGAPHSWQSNVINGKRYKNKKDDQSNWLSFQEEYSDKFNYTDFMPNMVEKLAVFEKSYCIFASWQNCSGSIIWHLLRDLAQGSFVRVPMFWYKLI